MERDFGMLAPPVALHSPAPGTTAAAWMMLRETLVAGDPAGRPDREAIAAAVSHANSCPYCTAVHEAALGAQTSRRAPAPADGPRRERIVSWALGIGRTDEERTPVPFDEEHVPRFLGVAVTFHYLNRMVNVFLADSPVPAEVPVPVRRPMMSLLGRIMRESSVAGPEPGAALDLLPEASLPDDLAWARGDRFVAAAFARAAAAVEAAGRRTVPEPVRELVADRLARWDGGPPGLGRGWVDEAVRGLPDDQRPAGRLALLTAFASYRVGVADVTAFRRTDPGDRALVELTAWAALTAARRIGALPNNAR
ncbi:carboxymuconolactone decarboxylase family protein [Actinomadura sp. CNU-125]|uniref:carboxymuconolactone decarboxylase family protein n=1 Tax=Actinomadura sp. CNU-125 TaxID=1904961 RepID=UPI001177F57E|nr:carboxymuconolactone decarboxylase family protein [Actinomadura sp. CNU-125]